MSLGLARADFPCSTGHGPHLPGRPSNEKADQVLLGLPGCKGLEQWSHGQMTWIDIFQKYIYIYIYYLVKSYHLCLAEIWSFHIFPGEWLEVAPWEREAAVCARPFQILVHSHSTNCIAVKLKWQNGWHIQDAIPSEYTSKRKRGMKVNDVLLLFSGDGLQIAAHLRGTGFWTNCWWMLPSHADSSDHDNSILLVQAQFKQRPFQEGRMGMMGYTATMLRIQLWVLQILTVSWKWMEVDGSGWKSTIEGGRDVPPSPKRTGMLGPFTRNSSWSVHSLQDNRLQVNQENVGMLLILIGDQTSTEFMFKSVWSGCRCLFLGFSWKRFIGIRSRAEISNKLNHTWFFQIELGQDEWNWIMFSSYFQETGSR